MEDNKRCCNPVMSRPAAACLRRVSPLQPFLSKLPVFVQKTSQPQLGGVGREAVDIELQDAAHAETAERRLAEVVLEPADHDVVQVNLGGRNAAAETLGVEDLQQGGETVGMAVVRRRREEQAVLEARGKVPDGAGDL